MKNQIKYFYQIQSEQDWEEITSYSKSFRDEKWASAYALKLSHEFNAEVRMTKKDINNNGRYFHAKHSNILDLFFPELDDQQRLNAILANSNQGSFMVSLQDAFLKASWSNRKELLYNLYEYYIPLMQNNVMLGLI